MASLNGTSTGVLTDQARSPNGDPKDAILPWLIGTMADNLLQGIITIQLLNYFSYFIAYRCSGCSRRPRDIFVVVLGVLSFAKTGQCVAIVWEHNITYKLNPDKVYDTVLHNYLELLTPFTTAILGYLVQIYSLIWYWKMSRRFWVAIWCSFWLLSSFFILMVATMYLIQGGFDMVPRLAIAHSAVVAIADFSLSVALGRSIWHAKSELPGPILSRLARAVIISGLPCAIAALIILICCATLPTYNLTSVIFNLSMAKLYVISCLYMLNCRNELREEYDMEEGVVDLDLDDIRFKTGDWGKPIGPAGGFDEPGRMLPLEPGFCPCDRTTLRVEVMHPGPGGTIALHGCGLSSNWFILAGDSAFTPIDGYDIVDPYSFERLERRKTIGGSDMV